MTAVPSNLSDRCQLNAHREQQRRVAKVMNAELRNARLSAETVEDAVYISRIDKHALCSREDEASLAPSRAGGKAFFELPFSVGSQNTDQRAPEMGRTVTDASVFTGARTLLVFGWKQGSQTHP